MRTLLEVIRRLVLVLMYVSAITAFGLEVERAGSLDVFLKDLGFYIGIVAVVVLHWIINFIFLKDVKRQLDDE